MSSGDFWAWAVCRIPHTRVLPCTSESAFECDHHLTIVLIHSEVSLGLQMYLNRRELGKVAMTSRFALDYLTWCLRKTKINRRVDLQSVWVVRFGKDLKSDQGK